MTIDDFNWLVRYFPKSEDEFVGNVEAVSFVVQWAKKWSSGETLSPLLLWGQSGSGKTALAYFVARKFGWDVLELNSSNVRTKEEVLKVLGAASVSSSFSGSKRLILIDEVDSLGKADKGGLQAINEIIKSSKNPVILTANDIFSNRAVSQLRFSCKPIEFKKINYLSIAKRLKEILSLEKIPFDDDAVVELAKNSNGDMRSALLDLESVAFSGRVTKESLSAFSSREHSVKVFDLMKQVFKKSSFDEVRSARLNSDLSPEMIVNWVEENIPRQYRDVEDCARAFNFLSRSDIFSGRIYKRQHWGFLSFSQELACEGVALSKTKVYSDFVVYQFPTILSFLSKTSPLRSLKKGIGLKAGEKLHCSSSFFIRSHLPYFVIMFKNKRLAVAFSTYFGFDEEEIAFFLGLKPDSKLVREIFDESKELVSGNAKPKPVFQENFQSGKQTKLF
ncbi:MAG: replication factor C large subunit [Candidatus Diapherotrites archaeon]